MSKQLKILWASPNTLLDTANGAGLMVRECMRQLTIRGCEVSVLSATIFVNPEGMASHAKVWNKLSERKGQFADVNDGNMKHRLLVTQRPQRRLMLSHEEQRWFDEYCRMLDEKTSDIVLFFDNSLITLLTANEARRRHIPVGVFLMHGNNHGGRWCRDVDWMFTDTQATASMYKEREGYDMIALGTFIDPEPVRAVTLLRQRVLFVNPIPAKGTVLVIQLALWLRRHRPDIPFEVVDTRGTWQDMLTQVSGAMGESDPSLPNVLVTPNCRDMRPSYSRARLLLVPSLWWDSGPRVIVEALLNGIPVIASDSGGIPEVLGEGAEVFDVPAQYKEPPYMRLFPDSIVSSVSQQIIQCFDDEPHYQRHVARALAAYDQHHHLGRNSDALLRRLTACIEQTLQERAQ